MRSLRTRSMVALAGLAVFAAACGGGDDPVASEPDAMASSDDAMGSEMDEPMSSAEICDADGLVEAVEGGPEEGTLAGMSDDPVGTAASSNPILTTLVQAVVAADLVDTLNGADALTVFAPTDCAFAGLDGATLQAALDDPSGLLTTVLGYHVIAGQQIAQADLSGDYETFTGETLTVNGADVGGQASIVVGDIQTANATVHLIDTVLIPPSVSGGDAAPADSSQICDADGIVAAVEGGPEEGTLAGMSDDPVGTAASSNPVLTTLVTAVQAAGLVDTLNGAEALTVFAPTDCAFAALDGATLQAALDDPQGLLTTVLGYHVIAGQRIAQADLSGDYEVFTGETLTVNGADVGGQATIVVGDIMTANATVHLISNVLLPPSVTG